MGAALPFRRRTDTERGHRGHDQGRTPPCRTLRRRPGPFHHGPGAGQGKRGGKEVTVRSATVQNRRTRSIHAGRLKQSIRPVRGAPRACCRSAGRLGVRCPPRPCRGSPDRVARRAYSPRHRLRLPTDRRRARPADPAGRGERARAWPLRRLLAPRACDRSRRVLTFDGRSMPGTRAVADDTGPMAGGPTPAGGGAQHPCQASKPPPRTSPPESIRSGGAVRCCTARRELSFGTSRRWRASASRPDAMR